MKKLAISVVLISLLTSCATYKSGRTQQIKINSNPQGAACSVSNKTSSGNVITPGVVEVNRSMSGLEVSCHLDNYGVGETKVNYGANWWSAGNVALLGLPYFYDMYTGAAAEYPSEITVTLKPSSASFSGDFMMKPASSGVIPAQAVSTPQVQQMQMQPSGYTTNYGAGIPQPQQPMTSSGQPQQNPYTGGAYGGGVYGGGAQQIQQAQPQYIQQPGEYQRNIQTQQQVQQPQTQEQLIQEMMQERKKMLGQ